MQELSQTGLDSILAGCAIVFLFLLEEGEMCDSKKESVCPSHLFLILVLLLYNYSLYRNFKSVSNRATMGNWA